MRNVYVRRTIWIAPLAVAVVGAIYGSWAMLTRTSMGVGLLGMRQDSVLLPSSRLNQNLGSSDTDLVRESLGVLASRKDPSCQQAALPLLQHNDPYVWFNAALYLGTLKNPQAVPYLIKGLRHPAWRSYGECAAALTAITGQSFGTDFNKWHDWWLLSHPASDFNFDDRLGKD